MYIPSTYINVYIYIYIKECRIILRQSVNCVAIFVQSAQESRFINLNRLVEIEALICHQFCL